MKAARHLLTGLVVVTAVLFLGSIVFAVLGEAQSDYLGARSEAAGGFDPSVFPPFSTLTWLMALSAPFVTGLLLVLTITARVLLRDPGDGESSRQNRPVPARG